MSAGFEARYYDGRSAQGRKASARIDAGRLRFAVDGAVHDVALADVELSERLARAPRLLRLPDGGSLEVIDHAAVDAAFAAAGRRDSLIVRAQNHWPTAVVALIAAITVIAFGYLYGLPLLARAVAPLIPAELEARIGEQALSWIDDRLFGPSELPAAQRERLAASFARIAPADARAYRIEFRASKIGPNAFALPGGTIVITDQLVRSTFHDEAVLGVLAHELGHVQERHFLRRMISSTITGAVATLIAGDASGLLTALPATLADLSFSRDMEREADRYAIALLRAHGVPLRPLADLLEQLEQAHDRERRPKGREAADPPDAKRKPADAWPDYLSTHPDTRERVRTIRDAAEPAAR